MHHKGITLIELLIVLSIIGIITSIVIPSYQHYLTKARRSDAYASLMNMMSKQERYYSDYNSYTTALTRLGYNADNSTPSLEGHYELTASPCDKGLSNCILLKANPVGIQLNDSTISLDSQQRRYGPWD